MQGNSSFTMTSEWGVSPPFCNRVVQKLQDGSSPTMISEWGMIPFWQQGGSSKKSLFCDNPQQRQQD